MFSRLFCVVAVFAVTVVCAVAQPALEMQDTLDFGNVIPEQKLNEQATVHGSVTVRNTGDSTLIISDVRPSCGCTTPKLEKDTLAPGEATLMNVGLNLPVINGELHKTVSLTTNDPKQQMHVLNIHVNVQRPVQLSSSFVPFNKGFVGDTIRGSVQISVFGKEPVTVETEIYNEKLKLISPAKVTVQPGDSMELIVGYLPDKPGVFSVQVLVKTSAPGYESFDLRGYGVADAKP